MTVDMDSFGTPRPLSSDLILAIVSVGLIFIARPLFAQTFGAETATAPMTNQPTATQPPVQKYGGVDLTDVFPGSYVNPLVSPTQDKTAKTPSSQSQRAANTDQNNLNRNSQVQPMPECKVDDAACIEQRNRNNPTSEQTAPTFVR